MAHDSSPCLPAATTPHNWSRQPQAIHQPQLSTHLPLTSIFAKSAIMQVACGILWDKTMNEGYNLDGKTFVVEKNEGEDAPLPPRQ